MSKLNRRNFIAGLAAATGAVKLAPLARAAVQEASPITAETPALTPAGLPIQSPLGPGGAQVALERLCVGSDGKTPTSKDISLDWVRALAQRGSPEIYTRANSNNFAHIGMPIGGIGAGQLYLGGDGKLWCWDIFNTHHSGGSQGNYMSGQIANSSGDTDGQTVIAQGFAILWKNEGKDHYLTLDKNGFRDISFLGQYPIGEVNFSDTTCPVKVKLEAFSPFIPLSLEDSAFPATILNYTLTNTTGTVVECAIAGWMENMICNATGGYVLGNRRNRIVAKNGLTMLMSDAKPDSNPDSNPYSKAEPRQVRPPITFEDFSDGTFNRWHVLGEAFGKAPATYKTNPRDGGHDQQIKTTMLGKYMADSFHVVPNSNRSPDSYTGRLTSHKFKINRTFINVHVAGGGYPGQECVNLIVDSKVVRGLSGNNSEAFQWKWWNVSDLEGKTAHLEMIDSFTGGWGHIMVDRIIFADRPQTGPEHMLQQPDFGTTVLAMLGDSHATIARADVPFHALPAGCFDEGRRVAKVPCQETLMGSIGQSVTLKPGESTTVTFILGWHFANPINLGLKTSNRRWYGTHFKSASDVVTRVAADMQRLAATTRLWRDTWNDSTLPHWVLDRTFLNSSTLATAVSYLMDDGRFYATEGVYCCAGTCTHVWGYTHTSGCLFPEIEKRLREMVDFNPAIGMNPDGGIGMRGEFERYPATDGQCGIIFRMLKACRMSVDSAFLKKNYEGVQKAVNYLIDVHDPHHTGLLGGSQANTLDSAWSGTIPWMTIHYQGALRAFAVMADQLGHTQKAAQCRQIAQRGANYVAEQLFNGEYFIEKPDPKNPHGFGSYDGCEIDQLLGQSWAYQTGLGAMIDPTKISSALDALWKYNLTTNAGEYRKIFKAGRWFAGTGDPGTIMCTWPMEADKFLKLKGKHPMSFGYYFNECWTGCEHDLASLMIWHGKVDKGLAVTRAVHDRYAAARRNPWNEIECSSHYSRAMSSYGTFNALCGYEYDGPSGYMSFSPRLTPEHFRAAFTSAQGWGGYWQRYDGGGMQAGLDLGWGKLALKTLALQLPPQLNPAHVRSSLNGKHITAHGKLNHGLFEITFDRMVVMDAGQKLKVLIS